MAAGGRWFGMFVLSVLLLHTTLMLRATVKFWKSQGWTEGCNVAHNISRSYIHSWSIEHNFCSEIVEYHTRPYCFICQWYVASTCFSPFVSTGGVRTVHDRPGPGDGSFSSTAPSRVTRPEDEDTGLGRLFRRRHEGRRGMAGSAHSSPTPTLTSFY